METLEVLNVPSLAPAQKHPAVFKTFDSLKEGASFILQNDHDPIPLFYEMKAELGDTFIWEKLENGPEIWRVKLTKSKAATQPTQQAINKGTDTKAEILGTLNVTLIEPRLKHPTIFEHFDALQPGQAFYILNDHDPKPLYYQMIAVRGNVFTWKYEEQGPDIWKVLITKNVDEKGTTVGALAAADIRKAEVFKKYGIDFCCGGKKTLKQACAELNLDATKIEKELQQASEQVEGRSKSFDFNRWSADFLVDYIYNEHHQFYYDENPVIAELLEKVANHHGANHPELFKIEELYRKLQQELNAHFLKEERVLFPHIKNLVQAKKTMTFPMPLGINNIEQPVQMMEEEHEEAGTILRAINEATNNYTPPADACKSYSLLYHKLKNLEEDLHQHIHLENNILFPKAEALEQDLKKLQLIQSK
jgi:regulator of cell morphogenesis and NO signaling